MILRTEAPASSSFAHADAAPSPVGYSYTASGAVTRVVRSQTAPATSVSRSFARQEQ
jgi:hypothetical protein